MSVRLNIFLTDDQTLLLDGLTSALERFGHQVIGAFSDIATLRARLSTAEPDVCVIDSRVADSDTIAMVPGLIKSSPTSRIVVLTADYSPTTLTRALDAGAAGYVHKTRGVGVLHDALQRVAMGQIVVEASFSRAAREVAAPVDPRVVQLATYLTPRERECLRLLTTGLDTSAMAGSMGVSPTTVRTHVQAVLFKLNVHSRLEAVSLATRYGLVRPTDEIAG